MKIITCEHCAKRLMIRRDDDGIHTCSPVNKEFNEKKNADICECGYHKDSHVFGGCIGNRNMCECKEFKKNDYS